MVVEKVCTITAKGQTTVPKAVRQALGVGYGGRIAFRVEAGAATVRAADDTEADPALTPFLDFLARDMAARPEALLALARRLPRASTRRRPASPAIPTRRSKAMSRCSRCCNAMAGRCSPIRSSSPSSTG